MIEETKKVFYQSLVSLLERARKKGLVNERAWDRFQAIGLPTKKTSSYQYLNLLKLYQNPFKETEATTEISKETLLSHVLPECKNSYAMFIDGHLSLEYSDLSGIDGKAMLLPFSQATKNFGAFLSQREKLKLKDESDPLVLFNESLAGYGAFLYLPPKAVCPHPIQILSIQSSERAQPKLSVFASAHSSLTLVLTPIAINASLFNHVTDIALEENSTVTLIQTTLPKREAGWHFDAVRATLKKNSRLKSVCVVLAGPYRADYKISLTQENAEASLYGVFSLEGASEAHAHVTVEHQAENCQSRQLFKNVLNDTAKSSFEGKILVRKEAQKTNAYQLNQNLLLGKGAFSYSKPNLEIFADDVKASHGSTTGSVDPNHLFYLTSRGLSKKEAKNLLVQGFIQDILAHLPLDSLKALY